MIEHHTVFERLALGSFQKTVVPLFHRVLNSPAPIARLFPARMTFRLVDVHFGLLPDQGKLRALSAASRERGYDGYYHVFVDLQGPESEVVLDDTRDNGQPRCWYVPFSSVEKAEDIFPPFSWAMVSPQADWVVLVTHENFLLLGAAQECGKRMRELLPDSDEAASRFLRFYERKSSMLGIEWPWVDEMLRHIRGNDSASNNDE